jgi:hypothetical protein
MLTPLDYETSKQERPTKLDRIGPILAVLGVVLGVLLILAVIAAAIHKARG